MILRVMRGRGSQAEVASLRRALDALDPASPHPRGLERFHLGWRKPADNGDDRRGSDDDREVVVVSHWSSAEAAATADAEGASPVTFARQLLRDFHVAHFEVDDRIRRLSAEAPIAIRIATGCFSRPGADSEMQNLLRERAPLIGDEMAEAWVGRRLTGREVEVTFVSTWRRLPADRKLDEAFWPDIALRYDEFVVEVYSALAVE